MGKWTLAHTEALCNEKFHAALEKPLSQSGLKLEEFFEAFDPQDLVVQKLIGALVNDIVLRRKSPNRTSSTAGQRCAEASFFINHRATDAHPGFRSRQSTIRARRRGEIYASQQTSSEMPWRTSYSSWSPDAEAVVVVPEQPSLSSSPYRSIRNESSRIGEPEQESSGEYWWRAAMQGHTLGSGTLSASPTPFNPERSPSPIFNQTIDIPSSHGFIPWGPGSPAISPAPRMDSPPPPPIRVGSLSPPINPPAPLDGRYSAFGDALRAASFTTAPVPELRRHDAASLPRSPPSNIEIFRYDHSPVWDRPPSPTLASTSTAVPPPEPGPTTVTVEDSLWR